MENDVMFGKPTSYYLDFDSGIKAFRDGLVKGDKYLIQSEIKPKNGAVKLQIREIEPEKSAIFNVSLQRVPTNLDEVVYVKSDFSGCIKVLSDSQTSPESSSLHCSNKKGQSLDSVLLHTGKNQKGSRSSVTLETGDYLDVVFNTTDVTDTYLVLESWYRDWTLGDVYAKELQKSSIMSPYHSIVTTLRTGVTGTLTSLVALFVGYLGLSNFLSGQVSGSDERSVLVSHLGPKHAHADTPVANCGCVNDCASCVGTRSLEIATKNGEALDRFEVVEPRYAKPSALAISIPKSALKKEGQVTLRITATKRHKVSGIKVVKGKSVASEEFESLPLVRAYHHRDGQDYTSVLSAVSDDYVTTYPSDVLSLEFATPKSSEEAAGYSYIVGVSGVYAWATPEDQMVVGNWVKALDEDAKSFLENVYKEASVVKQS